MAESHVWQPLLFLDKNYAGNLALIKLNTPFSDSSDIDLFRFIWMRAGLKACADGGSNILHDCQQLNHDCYMPNFISGDFDSIRPEVMEFYRKKSCEIISTPDQNETDFTKCLRLVVQKLKDSNLQCDRIITHVDSCGRLDHIMSCINTLFKSRNFSNIPVYLVTSSSLTFLLPSGKNVIEVDGAMRGSWCSLVPIGRPSLNVTTSGLRYNLDKQALSFGDLISTSNEFDNSSVVCIESDQPLLWSMEVKLPPGILTNKPPINGYLN